MKSKRGFASMSQEKRSAIASLGGKRSHELGRGHVFSSKEATVAGRKGGLATSKNIKFMSQIGKKGGKAPDRVKPY